MFYRLPLSDTRKPELLRRGNKGYFTDDAPIVSSDGHCAAYYSDESGKLEVYVASFPAFRDERRVSANGAGAPLWRKDGKEQSEAVPECELENAGTIQRVDHL